MEKVKKWLKDHQKEVIRWGISSAVTFLSAFLMALYPFLDADFSVHDFNLSAFFGVLFVAFRSGIKALVEFFLKNLKNV